jgi:hypothetical protein
MNCNIIRRKLVTIGTLSILNGEYKHVSQEWREEECGTPIFNQNQRVCSSCLSGWTHVNNYMVHNDINNEMIQEAKIKQATCH